VPGSGIGVAFAYTIAVARLASTRLSRWNTPVTSPSASSGTVKSIGGSPRSWLVSVPAGIPSVTRVPFASPENERDLEQSNLCGEDDELSVTSRDVERHRDHAEAFEHTRREKRLDRFRFRAQCAATSALT